ncbi:MAG TPA: hypothetical protein VGV61_07880, partial [Thermoanaerobaculia bacterium]|nr:hypothetical protein [Thermoanaerobaculia bacterium]
MASTRHLTSALALAGALVMGSAMPAGAALTINLSYVDTHSPAYARFIVWVDQAVAGEPGYAFSATDAVTAYRLSGNANYANLAIAMVEDQVTAAEAAIAAHQRPEVAGDSYLDAGGMIRDLALVYDWCSPLLTAPQRQRWKAYADQTVYNIWHPSQASWGGVAWPWSGWSTNNPGNNYHYSFLQATMYWAFAANDSALVTFLETDKLPALVAYFQGLTGGGSLEGTGYGVSLGRLFELYRVWRDCRGVNLADDSSHLVDTIDYWIHATVPTRDRYAPIGDLARESYPWLFDYHRNLVLQARAMAGAAPQSGRAAWWLHQIAVGQMQHGFNFRDDLLPAGTTQVAPAALHYHATGVGALFARTSWATNALWLSFVAGPYLESHAHQDQGAFNLFQGDWLAVTENIWTHSGIEQGTAIHNTLRFVNGTTTIPQSESTSAMTVTPNSGGLHVAANLAPAYAASGLVSSWQRTLDFGPTGLIVDD